jgi:hypothetical protein
MPCFHGKIHTSVPSNFATTKQKEETYSIQFAGTEKSQRGKILQLVGNQTNVDPNMKFIARYCISDMILLYMESFQISLAC